MANRWPPDQAWWHKQYTPMKVDSMPFRVTCDHRLCETQLEAYRLRRDLQEQGFTVFLEGLRVTWIVTPH